MPFANAPLSEKAKGFPGDQYPNTTSSFLQRTIRFHLPDRTVSDGSSNADSASMKNG